MDGDRFRPKVQRLLVVGGCRCPIALALPSRAVQGIGQGKVGPEVVRGTVPRRAAGARSRPRRRAATVPPAPAAGAAAARRSVPSGPARPGPRRPPRRPGRGRGCARRPGRRRAPPARVHSRRTRSVQQTAQSSSAATSGTRTAEALTRLAASSGSSPGCPSAASRNAAWYSRSACALLKRTSARWLSRPSTNVDRVMRIASRRSSNSWFFCVSTRRERIQGGPWSPSRSCACCRLSRASGKADCC